MSISVTKAVSASLIRQRGQADEPNGRFQVACRRLASCAAILSLHVGFDILSLIHGFSFGLFPASRYG